MAEQSNAFNVASFTQDWDKQDALLTQRQAEEQKFVDVQAGANKEALDISKKSNSTQAAYVDALKPAVSEFADLEQARQKQAALQDGSLLGALTAMQNAMLNPRLNTADGREKTRGEISQYVNSISTLSVAQQAQYQKELEQVNAGLAVKQEPLVKAELLEKQGMQVIQSQQTRIDTILKGLQSNHEAQGLVLEQMTPDQLNQSRTNSLKDGKTNVSGFDIPTTAFDSELLRRNDILYNQQVHDMAIKDNNLKMQQAATDRMLPNFTLTQKQRLAAGEAVTIQTAEGPKQYSGDMFTPGKIDSSITAEQKRRSEFNKSTADRMMFGDPQATITDEFNDLTQTVDKLPTGSPAQTLVKDRLRNLATAAGAVTQLQRNLHVGPDGPVQNPDPDQMNNVVAMTAGVMTRINDSKKAVDQAIEKQATLSSHGDPQLKSLYMAHYHNEPVPSDVAINGASNLIANGYAPTEFVGPQIAKLAQQKYQVALNDAKNQAALAGADSISAKNQRVELAQRALESALNESVARQTDQFLGGQYALDATKNPNLQSNPIAQARDAVGDKIFKSPGDYIQLMGRSDKEGLDLMRQDSQYSWLQDEDIANLKSGKTVSHDGHVMNQADFVQVASPYQAQSLLFNLETKQNGLGSQYTKWWQDHGDEYALEFVKSVSNPSNAKMMQDNVNQVLTADTIQNGMKQYQIAISIAQDTFGKELLNRRQSWVSYAQDPSNRQAALLQFDGTLTDGDKTQLFNGLIKPAMIAAKKQNLNFQQVNSLIDQAFTNPESIDLTIAQNKTLKGVITKANIHRTEMIKAMHEMMDAPWYAGAPESVPDSIWNRTSPDNSSRAPIGFQGPDRGIANMLGTIPGIGYLGVIKDVLPGMSIGNQNPRYMDAESVHTGFMKYDMGSAAFLDRETQTQPYDWYRKLTAEQK